MAKPAARVGDLHVCPMVDVLKPHVGGPVMPLAAVATVMIEGMPAAVFGTVCQCVGPPDSIVMGSSGVFIGGQPAARMGDMTAHGGTIVKGAATVLIGESGGGSGGAGAGGGAGFGKNTGAGQAADISNSNALKKAAENGDDLAERTDKKDFTAQFSLVDEAGKAKAGQKYEIRTSDGQVHSGKTDSSGKTEQLSGYTVADCSTTFFNE
ncbi:PAAR domain-containing protein [Nostoc ellipsosporum NOK]|jgi:uncharacterized Zn-binding protein involved in type VI secretion|nr:PAAR domain-containing protein [Nostoc ellipsosporum NOK]